MFEKVSRSLKYDSNIFFDHRHIYIWTPRSITLPRSRCACGYLELTKPITSHANGEPLLKRNSSHSYSSPVRNYLCLLSGLQTATAVLFLPRQLRYVPMGLCNRNSVILRTNRARCALYKEILDLLNKNKEFLESTVIRLVYKFDEKSTASV